MPVLNNHAYLREAVLSVINLDYQNWELIIVDDGSNPPVSLNLGINDNRIRITRNETNIGISRSLNKGLKCCSGDFIARFDSDDINLSNRLTIQIRYLMSNPEVGVLGSGAIKIDGGNSNSFKQSFVGSNIGNYLLISNFLIHPTVIIRKSMFDEYEFSYNEKFENGEDYELWIRLAEKLRIDNIPDVVLQYRDRENSQSNAGKFLQLRNSLNIQRKAILVNLHHYRKWPIIFLALKQYTIKNIYYHSYKSKTLRKIIESMRNYESI
jgi:glycosyltransferase involved in cell wall biosynthesis